MARLAEEKDNKNTYEFLKKFYSDVLRNIPDNLDEYTVYISEFFGIEGIMLISKAEEKEVYLFAKKERTLRDLLLSLPDRTQLTVFYQDFMKETVSEFIYGNDVAENCIKGVKRSYQRIGERDILEGDHVSGSFITSKKDEIISELKELNSLKKRIENSKFTVEGKLLVKRAVSDGQLVDKIIFTQDFLKDEESEQILSAAKERGIPYFTVSAGLMGAVTDTRPLPGIIASVNMKIKSHRDMNISEKESVLILDGVSNPDNLGMILRTADAGGIDSVVILKDGTHYLNKNAIRGARGAVGRLAIYVSDNDDEFLSMLEKNEFSIIGMSARAENEHFYEMDMDCKVAFVVGNESTGMSQKVSERCNSRIRIPMVPGQSSLNVAVSAGIVIYEYLRKRYFS